MKRESQKPDFKEKVSHYMDAGFPILYVNTFEEGKVGDIIYDVRGGRDVYEWNETNGYIHFETKTPENGGEDWALEDVLEFVKDPEILDQKILILKDTVTVCCTTKQKIKKEAFLCLSSPLPKRTSISRYCKMQNPFCLTSGHPGAVLAGCSPLSLMRLPRRTTPLPWARSM